MMKGRHFRSLLFVIFLEGVWAWIALFRVPSMERNSVLWGYSTARLGLGAFLLLVLTGIAVELVFSFASRRGLEKILSGLDDLLLNRYFLLPIVLLLLLGALTGSVYAVLSGAVLPEKVPFLAAVYRRVQPLVLWAVAVCIQSLAVLAAGYRDAFDDREFRQASWHGLRVFLQRMRMPLALVILCVAVMLPNLPELAVVPAHDSGIFLYFGSHILKGKLPYRDLWDHKPPLIFYTDSLGLWLGHGSRMGVWFLELAALVTAGLLAFYFLKRYFGDWPAGIATAGSVVNLVFLLEGGNLTEEFALPFQFFALFLFASNKRTAKPWKGWVIGAAAGAAFLFKQTMIGIWATLGLVILLESAAKRDWRGAARQLLSIGAGAGVVCFAAGLYFALQHTLYDFWDVAFRYNFIYSDVETTQRFTAFKEILEWLLTLSPYTLLGLVCWGIGVGYLILYRRKSIQEQGWRRFGWAIALILSGLMMGSTSAAFAPHGKEWVRFFLGLAFGVILFLAFVIYPGGQHGEARNDSSREDGAREAVPWPLWVAVLDIPIEILLISTSTKNYTHYFMVLLPSFSILIAFLLSETAHFQKKILSTVFIILLTTALFLPAVSSIIEQIKPQPNLQVSQTVDYILENTGPEDPVLVWGTQTVVNYLSGRESPTRFVHQKPLFRMGYASASLSAEFLAGLEANPPKLIINTWLPSTPFVEISPDGTCGPPEAKYPESMGAVFNYICQHYRLAEVLGKDQWPILEYTDGINGIE